MEEQRHTSKFPLQAFCASFPAFKGNLWHGVKLSQVRCASRKSNWVISWLHVQTIALCWVMALFSNQIWIPNTGLEHMLLNMIRMKIEDFQPSELYSIFIRPPPSLLIILSLFATHAGLQRYQKFSNQNFLWKSLKGSHICAPYITTPCSF